MNGDKKTYSPGERDDLAKKIQELVDNGSTQIDACKQLGVNKTTYAGWKQKALQKTSKTTHQRVVFEEPSSPPPSPKEDKDEVICLIGSSRNVLKALRGLR